MIGWLFVAVLVQRVPGDAAGERGEGGGVLAAVAAQGARRLRVLLQRTRPPERHPAQEAQQSAGRAQHALARSRRLHLWHHLSTPRDDAPRPDVLWRRPAGHYVHTEQAPSAELQGRARTAQQEW